MTGLVLAVLPSGLAVPPLPYLLVLAAGAVAVAGVLARVRPTPTDRTVLALVPWMVAGASLHALYQLDAAPAVVAPLFGAPAVYLTAGLGAGFAWVLPSLTGDDRRLGAVGTAAAVVSAGAVLGTGAARGTVSIWLPVVGGVAAGGMTALVLFVLGWLRPTTLAAVGSAAPVVVFGHALDGVSTALGVDLLGVGERSPVPRAIMDFAASLPTASVLGSGWLFVLVKLAVAAGVVLLFADFAEADPDRANAMLALVAAVGLGPGAHNLLLFATAGA